MQVRARYIAADRQAPENAARWFNRLLVAVRSLQLMPERNGVDHGQTAAYGAEVRRLVFERTYLLFYTIDHTQRQVTVVRFSHGARSNP